LAVTLTTTNQKTNIKNPLTTTQQTPKNNPNKKQNQKNKPKPTNYKHPQPHKIKNKPI
jgi:hypothetical protein